MNTMSSSWQRSATLLAINLLFLMVWGFTGVGKLLDGVPPWFGDKFGSTFLARFPGLTASFWLLAAAELPAFALALVSLARGEFLGRRPPQWLTIMLVWSQGSANGCPRNTTARFSFLPTLASLGSRYSSSAACPRL